VGFFIAIMIVLLGVFGLELIDGMVSLFSVDGDDEEWLAPLAMISLIVFVLALVYFG
jgi:hypothetical protein